MRKTRHTEIAIEVDQVITITRRPPSAFDWCVTCGSNVVTVTLEEGSSLISLSALAIARMVEAHQVHFSEIGVGRIRLCLPSLLQALDATTSAYANSRAGDGPSGDESEGD